ncbi:hypothetical protein BVC80_1767g6 [Macleaya cordata]|uniref:Uncharacterized protein n=1 Tax=Macleaya cordata TaxID=56857 RepID=A0A200QT95_MACCD|nr:hypothetical protein BVC80_1767g6 [Macleaya cordata]
MNRSMSSKEYFLGGGRNIPAASQHRRGRSLTGIPKETDENLDLFSRNRRSLPIASSDESDVSMKLERISLGSVKLARSGMDDLLSSVDGGKHDYDWLLTPPGTPLYTSSDASELQPTTVAPRRGPLARSGSTTRSSRLSVTQSENSYNSRPTRSSSATRPSISALSYNTYSSNNRSSILNTSISSVTSISRPSTPNSRSTLPSTARPSTPSRPSSSIRSRPSPTSSSSERARASPNPRPSTPTSRPQIPGNSARSNSRPSTPTRRISAPTPATVTGRSVSGGRALTNDHNAGPTSRGSSPNPRPRLPVLPDFPLDTPPNLRTTLPDRPISAGRSRPGVTVPGRGNSETTGPTNPARRQSSSPVVTRGRLPELTGKNRLYANGHDVGAPPENQRTQVSELAMRKNIKPVTATEINTGYGRTISKKSIDMALRHMDIRPGTGNIRPLSGTLFPQSIHSGKPKSPASFCSNGGEPPINNYVAISKNRHFTDRCHEGESDEDDGRFSAKLSAPDIYESSRYNAILFAEDLKSTNWLHSIDDKSDQGSIFDHRFEPLPEPFDPL